MKIALAVALIAAGILTGTASAHNRAYIDELEMSNTVEKQGITYGGRHVAVDNAFCLGLRRFGVSTGSLGVEHFWRFKCDLSGADDHAYEITVKTTKAEKRGWYHWQVLSGKRNY